MKKVLDKLIKQSKMICRFVDLSICRFVDLSICRFVGYSCLVSSYRKYLHHNNQFINAKINGPAGRKSRRGNFIWSGDKL